ncbi:MAG: M20 family metallopeptidase, partial [Candidatus Helarchaeales archaeon]
MKNRCAELNVKNQIIEEINSTTTEREIQSILTQLIRAKTVNPPGNEKTAADVIMPILKKMNMDIKIHEKEKDRTNIVASIGNEEPSLMIVCHLDVVPVEDPTTWKNDPFECTLENGIFYGRGTNDNKGQLASVLIAAKTVLKHVTPKRKLVLVFAADEERGSNYGMKYLLESKLVHADHCIVAEATECTAIQIAEKGILWLKLKSRGKQAHGSHPEQGINAIQNLSLVLAELKKFEF